MATLFRNRPSQSQNAKVQSWFPMWLSEIQLVVASEVVHQQKTRSGVGEQSLKPGTQWCEMNMTQNVITVSNAPAQAAHSEMSHRNAHWSGRVNIQQRTGGLQSKQLLETDFTNQMTSQLDPFQFSFQTGL